MLEEGNEGGGRKGYGGDDGDGRGQIVKMKGRGKKGDIKFFFHQMPLL